ncbi:MAG: pentapeptide repeat-containing protein [Thermodesulfobacteriota bacterium]
MQHPRTIIVLLLLLCLPFAAACGLMSKGGPGPADPAPGKTKLSGVQIDELVRGNTLLMEEYGIKAKVELHPNGTLRAFKQDMSDQTRGTWAIEEDTLCMKFKRWGAGDELCYAIYKVGEEYHQYAATGLLASRFTVATGVSNDPVTVKARRPHQTDEPAKGPARAAATDQPNVVAAEPAPGPAIQESTSRSYNPELARRDLTAIYRDMTQDCPGCNLANINLANANLMRANLAGANLSGANLAGANLKWANLKGANLAGANLTRANLAGAELAGANLERADLTGASLTKANLRGASIGGAIGINLKDALR